MKKRLISLESGPMKDLSLNTRKKKHHLFGQNFKTHIQHFIKEMNLTHPDKKIMISVSGGVDSVALVECLRSLNLPMELLHFNHGTRPEDNIKEEELVRDLGKKFNLGVNVFHFNLDLNQKNFEKVARKSRHDIYKKFIKEGYWIYTAHHIDDSFEWTLMQSFKQSNVKTTLGIPVFNNGLVRPFMCVTKKQILRFSKACELSWFEDSSNQNAKFERNFLRLKMTSTILKRYPKALRHYVSRQTELAKRYHLHRKSTASDLKIRNEKSGSVTFISGHLENHKDKIKEAIYSYSQKSRGEIDRELDKILSAHKIIMENNKEFPFKGPMKLSGGVVLFLVKDHLFIGSVDHLKFYERFDQNLKNYLMSLSQIPFGAFSLTFPQLVIGKEKNLKKTSKFIHPLLKVTCEWLKSANISYTFAPLLRFEDRQMLVHDAVILDSSLRDL